VLLGAALKSNGFGFCILTIAATTFTTSYFGQKYYRVRTLVSLHHFVIQALWLVNMLLTDILWYNGRDMFYANGFDPTDILGRLSEDIFLTFLYGLAAFVTLLSIFNTAGY
jgi:hypothetical protein